ncbi:zinc finger protein 862-like [Branchiostoma floridae x Branchiostoma japonicum]
MMLVLPISSAQCERGFSAQRRIKDSTRASMSVETVENLIRISADGPPLEEFDALPAVRKWQTEGTRSRRPSFSRPSTAQLGLS